MNPKNTFQSLPKYCFYTFQIESRLHFLSKILILCQIHTFCGIHRTFEHNRNDLLCICHVKSVMKSVIKICHVNSHVCCAVFHNAKDTVTVCLSWKCNFVSVPVLLSLTAPIASVPVIGTRVISHSYISNINARDKLGL